MDDVLLQKRAARRHALASIEQLIKQTPNQHLESSDLKAAGIRHLPLSIDGDAQHQLHSFKAYRKELPLPLKEKEDELLEFEPDLEHIIWETRTLQQFLPHHFNNCWELGDDKFGILLECIGFNWQALSATDYWATDYPHFKVIVESRAIGDNRLLRGEVMTITDIMATRLREKPLRPHIIAPILVFSPMSPRHARVLEADRDGMALNIRASQFFDFTERNTDTAQLLARYWLGDGCGKTTMETS